MFWFAFGFISVTKMSVEEKATYPHGRVAFEIINLKI